jgi:conflict system STAND superfamily ATPase
MPYGNPYGESMNIREPDRFFGRNEALDYLYSEIIARRCVSIVGTRRVGKSSLLRCISLPAVQQRFASLYDLECYLLVYIDLGEFLSKTYDDFFAAVCSQLLQYAKGRLLLDTPQEEHSADSFCALLDQIKERGFHTVLLFDAFHSLTSNTHFDARFFSFMRAQANHGRVSYVTASITSLDTCCHPYIEGSPFFNIFNVYRLGPLSHDETLELIAAPAQACGRPFTDEEVSQILSLAGRHPFFIQRVAYFLFQEKWQQNGQQRSRKFKQEAYEDLLPHFKEIWEKSLDAQQREYLREEAHWKHVKQRRLPELGEGALFRKFVRDACNLKAVDITVELLEELLKSINNSRYLGESELTHLYLFAVRAQHVMPRTVNEKGVIVRQILQGARDCLRPEGEQSDTAPEWQFYNILNYRYFKDHMRNEVLADLLGISVRQLHRERQLAIEALHEALHEMETIAREEVEFEGL